MSRISRLAADFAQENALERAQVCVELVDGSRHTLATTSAEPGFGFFSFTPHPEDDGEPRRLIVPIGAVAVDRDLGRRIPSAPHLGFAVEE